MELLVMAFIGDVAALTVLAEDETLEERARREEMAHGRTGEIVHDG